MLKIKDSGQFKKDYKKCVKRGLDMNLLKAIVKTLAIPEPLDIKNKDHNFNWKLCRLQGMSYNARLVTDLSV